MKIKDWIIKKLEKEVEITAGHINLEELNEEERNKYFIQFGEGDENLTSFLKSAYENGAPSLYCCSGHGVQSAYVVLKVTNDNIESLRKLGRILSKSGVVTNFENHYIRGLNVSYRSKNDFSTQWLGLAIRIIENPDLFQDVEPEIYYHKDIISSYKPFGYDLKKKLLYYLRKNQKELPEVCQQTKQTASNKFKESLKNKEEYSEDIIVADKKQNILGNNEIYGKW